MYKYTNYFCKTSFSLLLCANNMPRSHFNRFRKYFCRFDSYNCRVGVESGIFAENKSPDTVFSE